MNRSPFIRDVPAQTALTAWYEACEKAGCPARVDVVRLGLADAVGRVTAAPVFAKRSSPSFDAASMDGIAVRAVDTIGATETTPVVIAAGAYEVVDTGDPLPERFDSVVMREHVRYVGDGVELRAAAVPYQYVRSIGEDISATELLLPEGHRLRAVDVAACGAAGLTELIVRRQPVVAILPTGDEIRPIGDDITVGELHDTNSLMIAAQAGEIGCRAVVLKIERDDAERIARAVLNAISNCDLFIVVAGSSAGRDDYTASVIEKLGVLAVHGVAVRPGHPVVLGAIEATPVLGAPGYPVSAALTFEIFAAPLLAARGDGRATSPGRARDARPQARLTDGDGRLGPSPTRPGWESSRGDALAPWGRRAHFACAGRRSLAHPRRSRGSSRRRGGGDPLVAG